MDCINAVWPAVGQITIEPTKIRRKCVAVEEDYMVRVDGMNGLDAPIVPKLEARMCRVCRFV
jgi:hypothetical protein